jgi:hypothetical protein
MLKNKMTLSLTVNDILYKSGMKGSAKYDDVNYTMVNKWESRYINLRFNYNFGSTSVGAARNKSTGIEDETNRAGGR